MLEGKRVAVVVPAYNETDRIAGVLSGLPSFVDLVVVVDDASLDATSSVATAARPDAVVVRHSDNRGVGAAIATGYRRAVAHGADIVVVMAGDGQMSPLDLARIALPVARGRADYAKGDRMSHCDIHGSMPWPRLALGRVLSSLTRSATGMARLSDSQCGFTAISRDAIASIDLDALYPRYGYPNDLLGLLAAAQSRVVDVVVQPIYRGEKSGLRPWHVLAIGALVGRVYVRRRLKLATAPAPRIAPPAPAASNHSRRPETAPSANPAAKNGHGTLYLVSPAGRRALDPTRPRAPRRTRLFERP